MISCGVIGSTLVSETSSLGSKPSERIKMSCRYCGEDRCGSSGGGPEMCESNTLPASDSLGYNPLKVENSVRTRVGAQKILVGLSEDRPSGSSLEN